jgi:iron complex outermembrane receptor protein
LVEGLKLTAGFRYSVNKQSLDSVAGQEGSTGGVPNGTFVCQVPGLLPTTPLSGCHVKLSAEFKAPSWTLSADWQVTPSTLIYVASRRGFRAGGFNPTAIDPSVFGYGPEKLTDVEAGIKGHWRLSDFLRLRGSLAAYHSHVQDVQRFAAISILVNGQPTIITVTRNAGIANVNGVELQGSALLGRNVEFVANYAYTDATIKAQPGVVAGQSFGGVPRNVFSLMGIVQAPLDPKLGEVKFSATWYHQSKTPFVDNLDVETQAFAPAYSLINLRVDWRGMLGSNLDLGAFVNNAANKQYLVDGIIALDSSFGYSVHAFGAPRTFGMEAKYRF